MLYYRLHNMGGAMKQILMFVGVGAALSGSLLVLGVAALNNTNLYNRIENPIVKKFASYLRFA